MKNIFNKPKHRKSLSICSTINENSSQTNKSHKRHSSVDKIDDVKNLTNRSSISQNPLKEKMKKNLKIIFDNFSKIGKDNIFYLTYQSFTKILRMLNILDDNIVKICDVDIFLKKLNCKNNRISFEQFLNFITLISNKLFPNEFKEDPKEALEHLVTYYIEPFIQYINQPSEIIEENNNNPLLWFKNIEDQFSRTKVDKEIINIIEDVKPTLKDIYNSFFHFEINNYHDLTLISNESYRSLNDFAKEFEIVPFIFKPQSLYIIYSMICELKTIMNQDDDSNILLNKDFGKVFTYYKFCFFLFFAALFYFKKNGNPEEFTDSGKKIFFLNIF